MSHLVFTWKTAIKTVCVCVCVWFDASCHSCNQVKLVRVAGREGEQVYIQIGDDEMEMLTQQQAEQVSLTIPGLATHSSEFEFE